MTPAPNPQEGTPPIPTREKVRLSVVRLSHTSTRIEADRACFTVLDHVATLFGEIDRLNRAAPEGYSFEQEDDTPERPSEPAPTPMEVRQMTDDQIKDLVSASSVSPPSATELAVVQKLDEARTTIGGADRSEATWLKARRELAEARTLLSGASESYRRTLASPPSATPEPSEEPQRYTLERVDIPSLTDFYYGMKEDAEGDWVLFDDVAASRSAPPQNPNQVNTSE